MTKPQQRGAETEIEKGETSSPAPALHVLRGRGRSITMHIWHSQTFHGVTCVLLAGGCNLTGPRNIVAEISPLVCMPIVHGFELRPGKSARMPAVDRQGGGRLSFEGDILADGGSWHTRESSKGNFSTLSTFHVTVNG